jgi:iron complex transport system ATP-binding protein
VILLKEGTVAADGAPREVLNSESIRRVFGVSVEVFPDPVDGTPRISRGRSSS